MSRRPGLLTPLLLVSIAGCAGVSPATVRQDLLAGRSPGRDIEGVPFIPQPDHY